MIFSVSIGSSGKGDERYLLYIPFTVSPGRKISNINFEEKIALDKYEIGFEKTKYPYAVTISSFPTKDEACSFYRKIKSAFFWVSLKHLIGLNSPSELTDISLNEIPIPISDKSMLKGIADYAGWKTIDGNYDSDKCIIRPEHKRLVRWEGGQVSVTAGLGVSNFINTIKEAISFSYPENILNNHKLQLAIELYSSFFFEQSSEAKFIRLVTVLEALTPDEKVTEFSISVLNQIKQKTKFMRNQYKADSDDYNEINQLLSRIGQLKYKSIGRSLNDFIATIFKNDSSLGKETEILSKLKNLYNLRSKLLHEGVADEQSIENGLQFLMDFVPKLLQFLYIDNTNNTKI
jgi:hypothetical protein